MRVLVTNDDGFESPLLVPLLNELKQTSWCSDLHVVVPAENQSWISQAHSRKGALHVSEIVLGEHAVTTVSGTPADCSALGIANLLPQPPDIIVSGINLGTNAGLGFFFSSGTIGGANMGAIFGLPAIALSADVPRRIFDLWNARNLAALYAQNHEWERIARTHVSLVSRFVHKLPHPELDLLTVNTPWDVTLETEVINTFIEPFVISSLFERSADGAYRHKLAPIVRVNAESRDGLPPDFKTVDAGKVSITGMKFRFGTPLPEGFLS